MNWVPKPVASASCCAVLAWSSALLASSCVTAKATLTMLRNNKTAIIGLNFIFSVLLLVVSCFPASCLTVVCCLIVLSLLIHLSRKLVFLVVFVRFLRVCFLLLQPCVLLFRLYGFCILAFLLGSQSS